MGGAGIARNEIRERVRFNLGAPVRAFDARQVIQPVGVLQMLQLKFEYEVERRAEQATEQILLFGEAADPQVNVVEAGYRAGGPRGVDGVCVCGVVDIGAR